MSIFNFELVNISGSESLPQKKYINLRKGVIEKLLQDLDSAENATNFLILSSKLIEIKLKEILPKVFVQDKFVMAYAVSPLIESQGALSTTSNISKLLFAMGKISIETYADIDLYEQMKEFILLSNENISFDHDVIYDFVTHQSTISKEQDGYYLDSINKLKFSSFESFSQMRYESLIRIVLKLSCEMLLENIDKQALSREA